MKNKKFIFLGISGAILIILAFFFGIPRHSKDLTKKYDFFAVKKMDLSERIDATGSVHALEKKVLYADYDGTVAQVNVKAGDYVKKGDILLTINSATLKQQWQDANSALKQAQVSLSQAATNLATEVAINHVQQSNALQLENYTHQVALSREQVKQAQQRLDDFNAKNDGYYIANNEKLLIRAPFNGQIAWVNINQGDKITPQTILTTVMKPDNLGVEANIDQNDISLIKVGQKAVITGKDQKQSQNPGLVTEISVIGQTNGGTVGQTSGALPGGTDGAVINFPVRIKLSNNLKGLQPGMTVDVTVLANEHPHVLAIPAGSIIRKNGHDRVLVRQKGKIVQIPVQLGFNHGKYWEVKSGLKMGDLVAVPKLSIPKQTIASGAAPRPMMFGR